MQVLIGRECNAVIDMLSALVGSCRMCCGAPATKELSPYSISPRVVFPTKRVTKQSAALSLREWVIGHRSDDRLAGDEFITHADATV
jgi:hypothetical protein